MSLDVVVTGTPVEGRTPRSRFAEMLPLAQLATLSSELGLIEAHIESLQHFEIDATETEIRRLGERRPMLRQIMYRAGNLELWLNADAETTSKVETNVRELQKRVDSCKRDIDEILGWLK